MDKNIDDLSTSNLDIKKTLGNIEEPKPRDVIVDVHILVKEPCN